jgi:alpha-glucosidase (family GH31 glycosyl hydrolase)
MIRSGIVVKAKRKNNEGAIGWQDTDIIDLSDEEFANWWISITDDKEKFGVSNTLRKACMRLSDFGDPYELSPDL